MKQQSLHFQSSEEFQRFFSQLCAQEISDFLPVEGSGGDSGYDGISGTVAYQVFFPDPKNRNIAKYIEKIDADIAKIVQSKSKLGLTITDWILVVPDDLQIEVIAHLQKKSQETGIKCGYWGASKLEALVNKYPYVKESFPGIFLPPVHQGLKDLKGAIIDGQRPKVLNSVDIIGDEEYEATRNRIISEYQQKARGFQARFGDSSGALAADQIVHAETNRKLRELQQKKEKSDKAYQLDFEELGEHYISEIQRINEEMNKRGIFNSGIRLKALGEEEIKHKRELERLNLKYGKKSVI